MIALEKIALKKENNIFFHIIVLKDRFLYILKISYPIGETLRTRPENGLDRKK